MFPRRDDPAAFRCARRYPAELDVVRAAASRQGRGRPKVNWRNGLFRLLRSAPLRSRGSRGGPEAPGHVHRLDRLPRSDALPVGGHRQLRRRGPGRARLRDQRRPALRRQRRGPGPCARHPRRHRAEDRAHGRRGRLHQAARRRQVRLGLVRRLGRTARRRRVRGQRPVRAARRRGRPGRPHLPDVVPPRRARPLRRHGRADSGCAVHSLRERLREPTSSAR